MSVYDFSVKDINGNMVSLEKYIGKVLLIVNTATKCGFTPQYKSLQSIYEKYKYRGFEVLDFPCNQFANQAPGTNEEINNFCLLNYSTTFDRFSKIEVNGKNTEPLYKYLKDNTKGVLNNAIKWNFTKFLIDHKGNVVERYAPQVTPEEIESEIEKLL